MDKYNQTLLNIDFAKNFVSDSKLAYQSEQGWEEFSLKEIIKNAENFANFLTNSKLEKQNRIILISESRPEWGIAFLGSVYAGQILVPIDPKLTLKEMATILSGSCQPAVICFSEKYQEVALELKKQISSVNFLIKIDLVSEKKKISKQAGIIHLRELSEESPTFLTKVKPEEVVLIIYTSGTTGSSKGVMLTYRNLFFEFEAIFSVIKLKNQKFLSILPMNHMFELVAGFLYPIHTNSDIYYIQSLYPKEIIKAIKEQKITCMIVVPMFLNLIKKSIQKELNLLTGFNQKSFDYLYKIAQFLPNWLRRIVFSKIHQSIGSSLKSFVSGGAALSRELEFFLRNLGFGVYQGYGLTETSPVISVNTPDNYAFGSVGQALPGVEIKIEPIGERLEELDSKEELTGIGQILVRGDNVMKGYFNQADLTAEAIDSEGWFHTGDLGRLDPNKGFLYITGRLKNLIVLPGGKKVHPEEVEEVLSESNFFKEVCILGTPSQKQEAGSGTEEVSAVVVPCQSLLGLSQEEAKEKISQEVNALVSNSLASYKRPTRIFILEEELPKTATKKFKRKEILKLVSLTEDRIKEGVYSS